MKNLFRGYYKLTNKEIQSIWKTGFISLDTNVLFNMYRYSDETRSELLNVIKKYSSQLWLTNHTAFEFHKNRISVISEQIAIYDDTIKSFNKLENDIIKNLKTPHLSKSIRKNFEKTINETLLDLDRKREFYKNLLANDSILSKISTTFNNKVGIAFTDEEIARIEKEGEKRYKGKIPPGFKDNDKNENKYGDLIIWKELVRKSKAENKPFILIIDDLKEDWWLRAQGQTISPRPELSQELFKEAEQTFHLYTPDRFLEFASKTEKVKQETIDEVRDVRVDNYSPWLNSIDLSKSLFNSSSFADILKTNQFINGLSHLNSLSGDISQGINGATTIGNIFKNYDFFSNLGGLKSIVDMQNTFNSISGLTNSSPSIGNYLNEKPDDNEAKEHPNQDDKLDDSE